MGANGFGTQQGLWIRMAQKRKPDMGRGANDVEGRGKGSGIGENTGPVG